MNSHKPKGSKSPAVQTSRGTRSAKHETAPGKQTRVMNISPRTSGTSAPVQQKPAIDSARPEATVQEPGLTEQWLNTAMRPDLFPPPVQRTAAPASKPVMQQAAAPAARGGAGMAAVQRMQGGTVEDSGSKSTDSRRAEVKSGSAPVAELYAFRGVREVNGRNIKVFDPENPADKEELDEIQRAKTLNFLIYAGHVGVSIDNGATIYGLTPEIPEGMDLAMAANHLFEHTMTFPAVVQNDKPAFDMADRYHEARGWNTKVSMYSEEITLERQAELATKLQQMAGLDAGKHGIYYSFPLRDAEQGAWFKDTPDPDGTLIRGEMQSNCATFPRFIDIPLPELSGNLVKYIPAVETRAAEQGN